MSKPPGGAWTERGAGMSGDDVAGAGQRRGDRRGSTGTGEVSAVTGLP